jgi:NitT/TauT family transport system substrate-binding protein
MALYATYPKEQGGTNPRIELPFAFTPEVKDLIKKGVDFLYSIKGINSPELRPEAVMTQFADAVLEERKMKSPIGAVPALPDTAYHGK